MCFFIGSNERCETIRKHTKFSVKCDICDFDTPSLQHLGTHKSKHIALCSKGCHLKEEKKAIMKYSTLKIDFSVNFHLTHDFLLAEALSTPQKLENAKRNLQISIQGGLKLKKREGGVFHG